MGHFYVTTPIYYVNDLPHIGHIFTTVVADTVARYRRLAGDEVYFLTGTDEHGQNIERAAALQGVRPIELADRVVSRYHDLWQRFGMSHDGFIRTTEPRHRRGVEELIRRIEAAGDLYVAPHEGWYCAACETFYTEKELVLPGQRCPTHDRPAEWKSEENLFFRLSRYERPLLDWIDAHPGFIRPESRRNEVRAFVAQGLRDLSVSRAGLEWGIPFPGRPGQAVYVWLDALSNYLSALGFGAPEGEGPYRRFWEGDGERLHLIGKDIIRHHCVYWPAFLLSAGLPLPTTIWAHGWWLRDQKKMSKSTGNVVRPDHLVERFGPDVLRYFLLREMVFGQDASFSDEGFADRYNSDLANDLGNTASRVVTLSRQAFGGATPPVPCADNPVRAVALEVIAEYRRAMDELAFQDALRALWRLLAEANQYLVAREPWKLIKSEGGSERVSRILWNGLEAVRLVATGLLPVMPSTAERVLAAVGSPVPSGLAALAWGGTPNGAPLPAPAPLFPRIDKEKFMAEIAPPPAPAPAASDRIGIQQFTSVELRVGRVVTCEAVPKSEKLLKMQVDLGEPALRQVLAGIAKAYGPEELVGTEVVVVANLEPAKLMRLESQGMVLAA
ncbi:MAG TPA: methionine--tRNA ligase, partial [Thermoanaerobaculia bacterium]|nr:methionine--tRNA ligase [Thermoanaerobaculia bacterium]